MTGRLQPLGQNAAHVASRAPEIAAAQAGQLFRAQIRDSVDAADQFLRLLRQPRPAI